MSTEDKADYNPNDHLLNLKGKAYLPVAARLVWFRQDYPEGQVETTLVQVDDKQAIFRARVSTGQGGVAEATGTETPRDFGDYIEKAETKAVGRALGYLGYGTAAAGFEEGSRIVDAPQPARPSPPARANAPVASPQPRTATAAPAVVSQAAIPAPRLLTDAEYKRLMEEAWTLVEDGKTYIDVVAFVKRSRDRMTEAQYDQSRDEVRLIRKAIETRDAETPKPAAFAG